MSSTDTQEQHRDRDLEPGELKLLAVLGLPTFAYALATTIVSTYLPVLARDFGASSTIVGLLIAVEGIMALLLAVPAGALSDRRTSRLPFVIWGSPVLVVTLALMGLASSLTFALIAVVVFYAAYFVAYEPYRALYPDMVDEEIAGRGQSTQALWRGVGTIVAIASGGALLTLGQAVPFVAGAVVTAVSIVIFLTRLPRERADHEAGRSSGLREDYRKLRRLVRTRGDLRAFMVANGLWEASLGATKTFIILYLTVGLGVSTGLAGVAVAGGAIFIAAATPISGKLADRFGTVPVMQVSLVIYGLGMLIPFFIGSTVAIAIAAPFVGFGGGVVMTLPYALLIPLMGDDDHGLTTGLYSVSRGVGTALGPLLAGVAIGVLDGVFDGTQGYQAVWGVCAAAILLSVPFLSRLRDEA
ncbi:MFS transporter [Conexibacter woesei]|uniref:MFS transporter n=1 Tax=Conexibacter woesei TaxID=191495 RepID=UPI000425B15A|nr:MFS transporter [Conexibacter woesei]